MERRLLLAVVLSLLVVLLFQRLFPPPRRPTPPPPSVPGEPEGPTEPPVTPEGPPPGPVEGPPPEVLPPPAEPIEALPPVVPRHEIPGPTSPAFAQTLLTTEGGGLARVTLAHYLNRERTGPQEAVALVLQDPPLPAFLMADAAGRFDLATREWEFEQRDGSYVFWTEAAGLRIEKRISLASDLSLVDLDVTFSNRQATPRVFGYYLFGAAGLPEQPQTRGAGVYAVVAERRTSDVSIHYVYPKDVQEEPVTYSVPVAYGGLADKYFAAVFWPVEGPESPRLDVWPLANPARYVDDPARRADTAHPPIATQAIAGYRVDATIPAGGTVTHRYRMFLGPKAVEAIEPVEAADPGRSLDLLRAFGWPDWLSRLFLRILNFFHGLVPSYGLAIILLTFLVRAVLHPISIRGQRSLYQMQKMKPQMDEIKNRYKKDPQQMQAEMMKLYREHGVNPLGGCLPLFLQLPVFIGLYNSLLYAFELRQASFLYIVDLSEPDRLFDLPFTVPFVGWTTFNLLPLIMIVLMIVQQKMQPKPQDPEAQLQQKMMTYMFVFFGFLFYQVPSGLVLYFIVSSLIGMAEQKWIQHRLKAGTEAAVRAA